MTINQSKTLTTLAAMAGMTTPTFAHTLVDNLIKQDVIIDAQEFYGATVLEAMDDEYSISGIALALEATGIKHISKSEIDATMHLVLLGEDSCPICGGNMVITDGECRCIGGDGYNTPYEYETTWSEETCEVCGFTHSNQ